MITPDESTEDFCFQDVEWENAVIFSYGERNSINFSSSSAVSAKYNETYRAFPDSDILVLTKSEKDKSFFNNR